jgi:hypothetical protein
MRNGLAARRPSFAVRSVLSALVVALMMASAPAHADPTMDQCVDANTKAQGLRRDGKFAAARQQLRVCAASACPNLVRDDCAQRLDELERAQPTIVFQAQDGAGHDLSAVRITADGQPLADHLDGTAVAVDPGAHTFTFETRGQAPVSQQLVLREGEKARSERIVLGAAAPPPVASAPAAGPAPGGNVPAGSATANPVASTPEGPPDPGRTQRIGGLVVGGVGVVGVVVGTIYAVTAASLWNSAKNECSVDNCPAATKPEAQTDHDNALTAATLSTVGFVAGAVFAAAGIVLYFTAPKAPQEHATMGIVPLMGMGATGAALQGSF